MFESSLYKFAINKQCSIIILCYFSFSEFSFTFASQMYLEMMRGRNHEGISAYVHDTHCHDKFGQIMGNYHKKGNKITTEKLKFWHLVSLFFTPPSKS